MDKKRRERLKARQQQAVKDRGKKGGGRGVLDLSDYEDVKWYEVRVKQDRNLIDIIPFKITQEWYPKLLTPQGNPVGLEVGDLDYKLEIPVHKRVGVSGKMFLCLRLAFGKKCFLCEEWDEKKKDENATKEEVEEIKPKWRDYYNVVDTKNDEDEDIRLFGESKHFFEKNLLEEAEVGEDEIIDFSSLDEGKSVKFKGKEETYNKAKYFRYDSFDFEDREAYEEGIIDEAYPLDKMLIIPTYEDMQRCYLEMDEDDEPTEKEQEEEPKEEEKPRARGSRRPRGQSKVKKENDKIPEDTSSKEKEEPKKEPEPEKEEAPFEVDGECPHGHAYAVDCDEKEECAECDEWNACADAQEELNKQNK